MTLEYRTNFFASILPTGMYSLSYLFFMGTLLSKTSSISGWTFNNMLTLFAIEQLIYYSSFLLYRKSLDRLTERIRDGSFDHLARLPINTRLITSVRDQHPDIFLPTLLAIGFLLWSIQGLTVTFPHILLFLLLLLCGMAIIYNLLFLAASLSFWLTEGAAVIELVDEITSFSRFPKEIFPGPISALLMFIIPTILMVYVPAVTLLGKIDWGLSLLALLMVVVTFIISEFVWRAGLRHYSSASS